MSALTKGPRERMAEIEAENVRLGCKCWEPPRAPDDIGHLESCPALPSNRPEVRRAAKERELAPEMADMLRSLEWAGEAEAFWEGEFEPACPSCGALKNPKGHTPDCRLGTLLGRLP